MCRSCEGFFLLDGEIFSVWGFVVSFVLSGKFVSCWVIVYFCYFLFIWFVYLLYRFENIDQIDAFFFLIIFFNDFCRLFMFLYMRVYYFIYQGLYFVFSINLP